MEDIKLLPGSPQRADRQRRLGHELHSEIAKGVVEELEVRIPSDRGRKARDSQDRLPRGTGGGREIEFLALELMNGHAGEHREPRLPREPVVGLGSSTFG
jgi:hypothetical protein